MNGEMETSDPSIGASCWTELAGAQLSPLSHCPHLSRSKIVVPTLRLIPARGSPAVLWLSRRDPSSGGEARDCKLSPVAGIGTKSSSSTLGRFRCVQSGLLLNSGQFLEQRSVLLCRLVNRERGQLGSSGQQGIRKTHGTLPLRAGNHLGAVPCLDFRCRLAHEPSASSTPLFTTESVIEQDPR